MFDRVLILLELGYVPCAHEPRRSLALDYVYAMNQGSPKNAGCTFWFVVSFPSYLIQDGGHFQSYIHTYIHPYIHTYIHTYIKNTFYSENNFILTISVASLSCGRYIKIYS